MKKLLTFLICFDLLLSYCVAVGQEYDPFPTDTAKWSIYSKTSTPGEYSEWTSYYYLNGDTIIDSLRYSKIYLNPTQSYVIDTLNSIYVGGLREFNKEIFFKPKEIMQSFAINCELYNLDLSEIRLYTFNIELGEVFYPSIYSEEYTLSYIDSIFIGTEYRKIYTFQTNTSAIGDKWIEGMGSLLSLFGPFCYLFEAIDLTLCFEYDSNLFISDVWDPYEGCNHLYVGLSNQTVNQAVIYPNPFSSFTTIEFELDQPSEVTLTIFNHLGEQVDLIRQHQKSGKQSIQWQPQGLPPGLYFFNLKSGDQAATGKMVKLN